MSETRRQTMAEFLVWMIRRGLGIVILGIAVPIMWSFGGAFMAQGSPIPHLMYWAFAAVTWTGAWLAFAPHGNAR